MPVHSKFKILILTPCQARNELSGIKYIKRVIIVMGNKGEGLIVCIAKYVAVMKR